MSLRQRLTRAVIGRYPAVWRERYEPELLALIDDVPPRWRDVVDLSRGCIVERARALFEPADHPSLTLVIATAGRYLFLPLAVFAIVLAAVRGLKSQFGTLSERAVEAAGWIFALLALTLVTAYVVRILRAWRSGPLRWSSSGLPGSMIWLSAGAALLHVVEIWADEATRFTLFQLFYWIAFATVLLTNNVRPGQRLIETAEQLLGAREMVGRNGWARLELNRCETLASQGVPVADELARARAEMAKWQRVHDDAIRALQSMGYRARLQQQPPADANR